MNSLRARLIGSTLLGITLFLAAGGCLIYSIVEQRLNAELDRSLESATSTAAAVVAKEIDRLTHQGLPLSDIEVPLDAPGDLYQVWLEDGQLIASSEGLGQATLPRVGALDEVRHADHRLDRTGADGSATAVVRVAGLISSSRTPRPPQGGGRPGLRDGPEGRPPPGSRPPRGERGLGGERAPGGERGPGGEPPSPRDRPGFELSVARDRSALTDTLAQVRALLISSWALACLGCAAILFFGVQRGLRPVARLRDEIRSVSETDFGHRFDRSDAPDELLPVIQQLDSFVERIGAAFAQEKAFSANAAHELRTPLAGLRSTAELALMRERQPEEYRAALTQSLEITVEMQTLVEQLLDLTRPPAPERFEPTALGPMLDRAWADASATAAERDIELERHVDSDLLIAAEPGLAQRIVSNLIENAVNYADAGSQVTISAFTNGDRVVIEIINPAAAAPQEAAERAFDLFWRADEARTSGERHFGLGLPLSRRLAELLGGTLEAALENGTFRVQLELAAAPLSQG